MSYVNIIRSLTGQPNILKKLDGILLPATTPFSNKGELDAEALRRNLSKWLSTGIQGIVLMGSTGERVHLDEQEYLRVIEISRKEVPSDYAFIVGAGQQSTKGTIAEIQKAADCGADAVLVITPHFYRAGISQDVLFDYYTAVADASPVPVLLYSMPALTGIKLEAQTIAKLSSHPKIIGVKDSSSDVGGLKETVDLCPSEFAVMTGNGTVLFDMLDAGAKGGILAVGCVVPEICLEIYRSYRSGEIEQARELQKRLTPLATAVTVRFGIAGLKLALDLRGYSGMSVRAPLSPPTSQAKVEIPELLSSLTQVGSITN